MTDKVKQVVEQSGIQTGMCHLFLQHTSASIILCENADPDVQTDLETYMTGLVKDGDHRFKHIDEGVDDMSAHIRSVLTKNDLSIPIISGKLMLGIWQGIFLWEHRTHHQNRQLIVMINGE
ncbi:MAG: YjbQ family protein [Methylococcales bacterium]|nr:YjbQ family protein [Methylococcales bacterium]MBT7409076.1 YjbQ family protein [Methylococcales bacterium]